MSDIIIREMEEKDIPLIFQNIHKKYIVNNFKEFLNEKWIEHKNWYMFVINSPYYIFYICEDKNNNFLATVRFVIEDEEINNQNAEINIIVSIFVKEEFRNKGIAKKVLKDSIKKIKEQLKRDIYLVAYILEENIYSIKLFKALNFNYISKENYDGIEHLLFELKI